MGAVKITALQERQIRDARMKGAGYRAIASVVGLDRDTIRNYCKKYGLSPNAASGGAEGKDRRETCPCCGKRFDQGKRGRRKKFCSEACRRRWWSTHPGAIQRKDSALYAKTCAHCGQPFVSYGNIKRKYCCHQCYIQERFWNKNSYENIR